MARSCGGCALVALLVVGGVAHGDRIAIAPLRVSSSYEVAGTLKEQFRTSVAGGLAASGHEVVADEKVAAVVKRSAELGACDTDVCYRRLGELVGVDAVVRGSVEVLGSSNYQMRLEMYDVGDRGMITYVEDACTVCTVREANAGLSHAAHEVGRRFTARVHAAPVVTTAQPGPPQAAPIPAQTSQMKYTREWTPQAKGFLGGGITLLALGAGGVGAGASLIAIDGRTSNDGVVGMSAMESTLHTRVPGIALTAVGAAFLVGGSVLTWRGKWLHDHAHPLTRSAP